MHRLTVLYLAKDGEAFNYDYYFGPHHKLVVSRFKPEGQRRGQEMRFKTSSAKAAKPAKEKPRNLTNA